MKDLATEILNEAEFRVTEQIRKKPAPKYPSADKVERSLSIIEDRQFLDRDQVSHDLN